MAFVLGPRCSTCPVGLPACIGQQLPVLCAPDDPSGDPTIGLTDKANRRDSLSRALSAIGFEWPSPAAGLIVTGSPPSVSGSGTVVMGDMSVSAIADVAPSSYDAVGAVVMGNMSVSASVSEVSVYESTGSVTMGNMHIMASISYSTDVSGGG